MASVHQHPSTTLAPDAGSAPVVNLTDAIVLKLGAMFVVSRRDGTVPLRTEHPLGLYRDDCRYLSGHELRVAGVAPRLLVASATAGEAVHELTNPDLPLADGRVLPLQTLQVRLERRLVAHGALEERLRLALYGRETAEIELELALAADFRPMFAIRGIVDLPAPPVEIEEIDDGIRFSATTSDGVRRATSVHTGRPADLRAGGTLGFRLALRPGEHQDVRLSYVPEDGGPGPARHGAPAAAEPATTVRTDDELFNRVVERSLADLRMLRTPMGDGSYFAAGVPWFATLFGRDSLITAIEMLGFVPEIGEQTLCLLADRLGRAADPVHEEEPGKVLHEFRVGEVATRELTPLTRYYGTVDATPLFLCLVAEHADWRGDLDLFRRLRDAIDAAAGWVERFGDHDGDGLLDYRAGTPDGLRNQGWKDSDDGVMHEDGAPLEPPIALVEAQAYAIRGLRGVARLFEHDGATGRAAQLRARAAQIEERLERFWLPSRGFYGMAIDGAGRTSGVLASNQAHLLWARVLSRERASAVRDALMSEEMFSGWGVRTLARGEAAYNPIGYHLGTVWPHDTAMAAIGLRNHGFDADFTRVFEGLLDAASQADGYRLPELFAGFSRTEYETPVPYPVACHPQAWASGAIPYMLVNALGLQPDGLRGRLRVLRPSLPRWVDSVELEGLAIAGSRVDLRFERTGAGDSVALTDAHIDGDVEVVLEISS